MVDRAPVTVALLLVSVVVLSAAAAGPVQAGVERSDRVVEDTELDPGERTSVTTTVVMDDSGGNLSISESFSPAFASVDNLTVTVDGEEVDPFLALADPSGLVVTFAGDLAPRAVVNLTYTVRAAESGAASHAMTGETATGRDERAIGESTLDVVGVEPTTETATPRPATPAPTPAVTATPTPATTDTDEDSSSGGDGGSDGEGDDSSAGGDGSGDDGADDAPDSETTTGGSGPTLTAVGWGALLAALAALATVAHRRRASRP